MNRGGRQSGLSLAEFAARLRLVDHHVHGAFRGPLTRTAFEESLNEGSTGPVPSGTTSFDSQLGFAVRRWCAPLLGLPAHAPADDYWRQRALLGEQEAAARLLPAAGVDRWIVDTGYGGDLLLSPAELAGAAGGTAYEVVRLEALAESLAASMAAEGATSGRGYADAYRDLLRQAAAAGAVGLKTVVAYRAGLDLDWSAPDPDAVRRAAGGWLARCAAEPAGEPGGPAGAGTGGAQQEGPRLTDPVLLRFGVHCAVEMGLPLQIHTGLGDRDLDLHRADPMLLLGLLRQPAVAAVPVMLLHCYPYHRQAGYLAQAFDRVYCDVGLAVNHLGARSAAVVAESMELAPFGRLLYSSDAWGPAELHVLGAALWRRAAAAAAQSWVDAGDWSEPDARRVLTMIGRDNALSAYGL
ncbi:amidohydrolase family protein [Streptomyces sp. V4-01]|uniref:Amidohydrolase family protein n=1 Tax=Actinacidiphila polyblastidii TaxID=3110430 RepID=A0ABU7PAW1_9ACTN|nr:amidohydrolase family protein [Streptomyces sp. V4-01]